MKVELRTALRTIVLTPEAGDEPEDLQDSIHDSLLVSREGAGVVAEGKPAATLVVLDFSHVGEAEFPRWMKEAGPEIPDANLRVVVSPARLAVARALGLTFYHDWFSDLEEALRGGW